MTTVYVGSARIDEFGNAHGGQAGDQTAKEVSTQKWYKHSKGWRVLRALAADRREYIAAAMEAACDNANIGYDQWQRDSLLKLAEKVGYDIGKVTEPCETDCSALVRVCCAHAFLRDIVADVSKDRFYTGNMVSVLIETGHFQELTGEMYTDQADFLMRGDILVTKEKGHTVVVLNDGDRAYTVVEPSPDDYALKRGIRDSYNVRVMQAQLARLGYLQDADIDGDFGPITENALKAFQTAVQIEADGEYGPITRKMLTAKMTEVINRATVKKGSYHIRTGPGRQYASAGIVKGGDQLEMIWDEDWVAVAAADGKAVWISKSALLEW